MEMFTKEKNRLGIAVQHTVDAKQSEPPGSEVQGNTSDSGVSELPNNESTDNRDGGRGLTNKQGGKGKKKGGRGRIKWTKEERCVLWECFIRSGGAEVKGYRDDIVEMWNGRDLSVRTRASVLAQVKEIQKGGKLSAFDMREIEERVMRERDGEYSESDIDFTIEVESTHAPSQNETSYFGGLPDISVIVERLDCVRKEGAVKLLSDEEKLILDRIRCIFMSEEQVPIPTLKGKDNWLIMREVSLINGLLSNVSPFCNDVSSLNKLLYAGSYVVCERLGLMKKKGPAPNFKKPWWQRRLERSVEQWRQDLGRVLEIRKGVHLKERVVKELERRYQLSERGRTTVVSFLKKKFKQL